MSGSGLTPSPWGDPARLPTAAPQMPPAARPAAKPSKPSNPSIRTTLYRWEHPTHRERARAALTMILVAIVLGAAAAVLLGIGVWAVAAFFHHAASG